MFLFGFDLVWQEPARNGKKWEEMGRIGMDGKNNGENGENEEKRKGRFAPGMFFSRTIMALWCVGLPDHADEYIFRSI